MWSALKEPLDVVTATEEEGACGEVRWTIHQQTFLPVQYACDHVNTVGQDEADTSYHPCQEK